MFFSKRHMAISTLITWILASLTTAHAEGEIQLGYPKVGYPPYLMPKDSNPQGIAVDLLHRIAKLEGLIVVISFIPDNRAAALQLTGKLDVAATAKEWTESPDRFLWSDPLIAVQDNILFLREKKIAIQDISDLNGLNLGTMLSYQYPSFQPAFEAGTITRNDTRSFKSLIKMVHLGRVDAAILDRNVVLWTLKQNPDLPSIALEISDHGFDPVSFRFRFSKTKNMEQFIDHFNRHLKTMRNDGSYEAIIRKYR